MRYHLFDRVRICETTGMQDGYLRIDVVNRENNFPIEGAEVSVSYGDSGQTQEVLRTNLSGQTEEIAVAAPPVSLSLEEQNREKPYADYTVEVRAEGYESVKVKGTEVLAGVLAVQPIRMIPLPAQTGAEENIQIPDHTLYGSYPPKIAEDEVKPVQESGEIVLSRVVVPQTIVVHDGAPTNASAKDYYVAYRDYIKNVASSEIYATWPRSTIVANVLAIMSFTLNRVYTEWYRNKGFDFTITSSTAFDHKWIYSRNIFESISEVVDELFADYLSRPNVKQPILTQYCDGKRVSCPNWLSQWGSKSLADQGYTATEILRYYYGDNIYINSAEEISGIPSSWPGYDLDIGATGPKVEQMQEQLNAISNNYPLIPRIAVDGIYGEETQKAVEVFQDIFNLPVTGIVDYRTWYKIQEIYVGVTRIAELR